MFVNYLFANEPELPVIKNALYEYVVGANGIFVRAERSGMRAMIPVAWNYQAMRGLVNLAPYLYIERRMPAWMLSKMFLRAYDEGNREILFYGQMRPWKISIPQQVQSGGSVHPVNPYAGGTDTVLEVHSHHRMDAFFSRTDNHDEQAGFRIFAVLGRVGTNRPEIRVRVGIYGHFWEVPAGWVFELPEFVIDANRADHGTEPRYVEVEDGA